MSERLTSIFCSRLVAVRRERKLTQLQLAELIPVSRTTYSSWEQGRSYPDLEDLAKICSNLNVSADYLIGLSDSISASSVVTIPPTIQERDPFDDLTPDQRTVIEATLKTFRDANAASARKREA